MDPFWNHHVLPILKGIEIEETGVEAKEMYAVHTRLSPTHTPRR